MADLGFVDRFRLRLAQMGTVLTDAQWDGLACVNCGRLAEECGPMIGTTFGDRTLFLCEDFFDCRAAKAAQP
jgi:hypothetical protein